MGKKFNRVRNLLIQEPPRRGSIQSLKNAAKTDVVLMDMFIILFVSCILTVVVFIGKYYVTKEPQYGAVIDATLCYLACFLASLIVFVKNVSKNQPPINFMHLIQRRQR